MRGVPPPQAKPLIIFKKCQQNLQSFKDIDVRMLSAAAGKMLERTETLCSNVLLYITEQVVSPFIVRFSFLSLWLFGYFKQGITEMGPTEIQSTQRLANQSEKSLPTQRIISEYCIG